MKQRRLAPCVLWVGLWLLGFGICAPAGWAMNARMTKAVKLFKDFDIRGALKILKQLELDDDGDKKNRWLYIAMCYVYLRKRQPANTYFTKVLKIAPSIQLPKGSPKRMKRMFQSIKDSLGISDSAGSSAPATRTDPAPTPRTDPAPTPRTDPAPTPRADPAPAPRADPAPAPRADPPPAPTPRSDPPPARRESSKKMTFGEFSMKPTKRREAPTPRSDPPPAPAPTPRSDPPATRQSDVFGGGSTDTPPARRVAAVNNKSSSQDPELFKEEKKKKKQPTTTGGGVPLAVTFVAAGLAVALVGGGAIAGYLASDLAAYGQKSTVFQKDVPVIDKAVQNRALLANVLYISAGVVGAASVIFFFLRPKTIPAPKTSALLPGHDRPVGVASSGGKVLFSSP